MILNFRHVLNVVCFLLGNSPASEFLMPTFRNALFHLHKQVGMKIKQRKCSEMSAYKIQTPGNHPEESIQQVNYLSKYQSLTLLRSLGYNCVILFSLFKNYGLGY